MPEISSYPISLLHSWLRSSGESMVTEKLAV